MKRPDQTNSHGFLIVALNVLLLITAVSLYSRYTVIYQERLREENLGNIANLNQSAAINATALINSWKTKLNDVAQYIDWHALTRDEALELLDEANSSVERRFQLVSGDASGYLAQRDESGAFIPVSYGASTYAELFKVFDECLNADEREVRFTPEFTDSFTALKHFAVCTRVSLSDEQGGIRRYALLLSSEARLVLASFNTKNASVLEGLSNVLVDKSGQYIVSNTDFKSDSFYQYLYVYNDLSLDQREEIRREMAQKGSGELYYKNAMGEDCVFRYSEIAENDWYCITCVPLSSFREPVFNANYALFAVAALLAMLGVDMFWLRGINKTLKVSILREKEASDAKTDFLSRMSHDIRTPLNGIIGLTILASDEKNPPKTAEYLSNIKSSGDFLLGLVNDILDMSKVESGKMELHPECYKREDFMKYIDAVIAPLCRDKGLELLISPPDTADTPVLFDPLRLNQVFFNLLSNSVKYTPPGGVVELSWTTAPISEDRVALDFAVRDTGIGMSEEFQKHMYESFSQERADVTVPGSGLGLSIVWKLVNLMGGSIRAKSKEGEGTTFYVHLEAGVFRESEAPIQAPVVGDINGRRALVCEDNQINAMITQNLLEKWGMKTELAANGEIGLRKFEESEPGYFDVVLMDIRMPVMNGLDATRAIRELNRPDAARIPIIAMTANAYDTDVRNCLDAGMNAHMGKPIQPIALREKLVTLILSR